MHCSGSLSLRCARCGRGATVDVASLRFRHAGTWEPSLIVVERFAAPAELPCGHAVVVRLEASDGLGGPDLRVRVDEGRVDAPDVRLWFGPGGVPLER